MPWGGPGMLKAKATWRRRFLLAAIASSVAVLLGAAVVATRQVASSDPDPDPLAAVLQAEQNRRAEALASGTPPPFFHGPPPTPWTPAPPELGIFDIDQQVFGGVVYRNVWVGLVDGAYVWAYAGGYKKTAPGSVKPQYEREGDEGLVYLEGWTLARQTLPGGGYVAPGGPGHLEITAEKDGVLTLASDSGTAFLFDVRTRLFIDPATGVTYPHAPTPTATPSPYHPVPVKAVRIDAVSGTNVADAPGPADTCAAVPSSAKSWNIDIVVDSIPPYDLSTGSGGISAFSFVLEFMPDFVHIAAVNPGGDSDTILAADGPMNQFRFIDGDAGDPDPDPLPSTSGRVQVDIADLSRDFESGSGVLARITLTRPASDLAVTWSNLTLRDVHLFDGSRTPLEYSVRSLGAAQVTFGGACS